MAERLVKIGGASGFWGDASIATPQLLADPGIDFIVYDYLAEITMSILARARARDSSAGYATDFVASAMAPNLRQIADQKVRIISNAGGVNPAACADAVRALIRDQGLDLSVSVVEGDDVMAKRNELAARNIRDMFSGAEFPAADTIASINAYLGAFPIALALDRGADIVITGRCVDSAVTLGACIHAFGWTADQFDRLAAGSLAGHILECGPQATGGNFTDWEEVADSLATIGYPIAEIAGDGAFTVRKPEGTGGRVSIGTVAEQMLYEIGDPQAYMLPDVVCDFSKVTIKEVGENRVRVSGASGRPPPATFKTCLTHADGFRGGHHFAFYGLDADRKARCFADAAIVRARRVLTAMNAPDYTETSVEIIGAESQFGDQRTLARPREVMVKLAARHPDPNAIGLLMREATGLALSAPPGLSGFAGTRPKPSPVMRLFSFELPKSEVNVTIDGEPEQPVGQNATGQSPHCSPPAPPPKPEFDGPMVKVPLVRLAWGRSGDKGDKANIGIIARHPDLLPWLWASLSEEFVADCFAHFLKGNVERYLLPGTHAINFVLNDVLGGGGVASLRNDPQGKGYAQLLLCRTLPIPQHLAGSLPGTRT